MDPTFHVINLDKRTDRWERISAQLASRGLRTARVKALEPPPGSGRPCR